MDKTAICNSALIEAEVDSTITSFDTDSSIEAQRMRRLYSFTKNECLSSFNWGFATRYVYLVPVEYNNVPVFSNVFKYPANALKIQSVFSSISEAKERNPELTYSVLSKENGNDRLISCDAEAPVACITVDVSEDNLTPLFTKYLYLSLALKYAKIAGASDDIKERLYSEINMTLNESASISAETSNKIIYDEENEYIDVRS